MSQNQIQARSLALAAILAGALWLPAADADAQLMRLFKPCPERIGSLRIAEPDEGDELWSSYGLSAPTRMLRVMVNESGCFTVVDRGAGLAAIRAEQDLAAAGQLREGQNVGGGQIRAADFVLIPDIVSQNANAGGSDFGVDAEARRGGLLRGLTGGGRAGLSTRRQNAEVILTLVDARTSEQVATTSGEARISDKAWNAALRAQQSQAGVRGGIHAASWENTEIGKVIKEAYEEAYKKMEPSLRRLYAARSPAAGTGRGAGFAGMLGVGSAQAAPPPAPVAPAEPASVPPPAPAPVAAPAHLALAPEADPEPAHIPAASLAPQHGELPDTLELRRTARLLAEPSSAAGVVAELRAGMLLFPTGTRQGAMIEVEDEMGQRGWVPQAAVTVAQ